MVVLRFFMILFNVAVVTYLLYRMLQVVNIPMSRSKKSFILLGGIILLLAPFGMFFRFFYPTIQYFLIYPIAIAVYLYMIREFKN
jgi:hypothetical protein